MADRADGVGKEGTAQRAKAAYLQEKMVITAKARTGSDRNQYAA